MAKVIKYKFLSCEVNRGTEEQPIMEQIILEKVIKCHTKAQYDASLPIAEKEAIPGTLDPDPNGEFDEEIVTPTAQDDTDAMLIDHEYRLTLLELGLTE